MAIESIVLAAPLFVFSVMLTSGPGGSGAVGDSLEAVMVLGRGDNATGLDAVPSWQAGAIFSIGAGIYEELVFRLIAIVLIHTLLADVFALPHKFAAGAAIVVSAIAFALYHPFDSYNPLNWSSADLGRAAFYTLAGLYFAAIYVYRGFGIVAATHALYDLMVIVVHFSGRDV
jgi:membrane protease YdiL (CAAX protease family)